MRNQFLHAVNTPGGQVVPPPLLPGNEEDDEDDSDEIEDLTLGTAADEIEGSQ
jgi:hypothetical protein